MQMNRTSGFSILELVIFIGIISTVLISVVSGATYALRQAKTSEHKLMATRQAQEMYEWLKSEKEASWNSFYDKALQGKDKVFCVQNDLNWTNFVKQTGNETCERYCIANENKANCREIGSPQIFKRYFKLTGSPKRDQIDIDIGVSWQEGDKNHNVEIKSVMTIWN